MYELYATKEDLAEYLNIHIDLLDEDTERLLQRASELINQMAIDNVDMKNQLHIEALKLATCAQVEFWREVGEGIDGFGKPLSYSIGKVSMNFGGSGSSGIDLKLDEVLSNRARMYLQRRFLLYRGIKRRG